MLNLDEIRSKREAFLQEEIPVHECFECVAMGIAEHDIPALLAEVEMLWDLAGKMNVSELVAENLRLANSLRHRECEVERLREEQSVCWCKDCKWYSDQPIDSGHVCVNADSDWCADYPPEYGSCEHCERRGLEVPNEVQNV